MNNIERIKELTKELNQYRHEYYNLAKPSVNDSIYDKKFDELKKLEDETGFSLSNSPTKTVGYEVVSKLNKVKHSHPMLSLDKCHTVEEVVKFANGKDVLAMFKLDGLTVSAEYNNGILTKLETRGNGEEGNDILFHAKSFENLPLVIEHQGRYVIDGEAIITYEDFEKINNQILTDKYKNPRNLASGTLNLLDSSISAKRHLKFIAWDIIEGDDSNILSERLDYARDLGFTVVPSYQCNEMMSKEKKYSNLDFIREEARKLSYPIDGVVFKFQDIAYGKSLGKTGHHFLNGLAYKYSEDKETSILRDIEWSMGKTGSLCPVALFDSVELAGTTVNRASLHNISIMKDLDIKIGSTVTVVKKNEIIPQIIECDADFAEFDIPTICPICGGRTEIQKPNDSEILVCTNEDCKGKLLGKLSHFVNKNAINIDGMSEATIEFLIHKGWISNFIDLYDLEKYKNEWYQCEGFGKKSVDGLIKAIGNSRNTTLDRFIYALSIPMIGRSASKTISKIFKSDYNLFLTAYLSGYKFNQLEDFGDIMNNNIYEYMQTHLSIVDSLAKEFNFIKEEKKEDNLNGAFVGKNIYCTGTFVSAKKEQLKQWVEENGGTFANGYAKSLDMLVVGSVKGSSKEDKALKDGVRIVSENEFIKMIDR